MLVAFSSLRVDQLWHLKMQLDKNKAMETTFFSFGKILIDELNYNFQFCVKATLSFRAVNVDADFTAAHLGYELIWCFTIQLLWF